MFTKCIFKILSKYQILYWNSVKHDDEYNGLNKFTFYHKKLTSVYPLSALKHDSQFNPFTVRVPGYQIERSGFELNRTQSNENRTI